MTLFLPPPNWKLDGLALKKHISPCRLTSAAGSSASLQSNET